MKIVINRGCGGFHLNHEATLLYAKLKGINLLWEVDSCEITNYYINEIKENNYFADWDIERTDPILIEVVEKLYKNTGNSLKVVEIPDDVKWEIKQGDLGHEWVAEKHRIWI
jgi:hypothetical protein